MCLHKLYGTSTKYLHVQRRAERKNVPQSIVILNTHIKLETPGGSRHGLVNILIPLPAGFAMD
jgi:hypothetical protein